MCWQVPCPSGLCWGGKLGCLGALQPQLSDGLKKRSWSLYSFFYCRVSDILAVFCILSRNWCPIWNFDFELCRKVRVSVWGCVFVYTGDFLLIRNVNHLEHKIWKAKVSHPRYFFKGIIEAFRLAWWMSWKSQGPSDVMGRSLEDTLPLLSLASPFQEGSSEPGQVHSRLPPSAGTSYWETWL